MVRCARRCKRPPPERRTLGDALWASSNRIRLGAEVLQTEANSDLPPARSWPTSAYSRSVQGTMKPKRFARDVSARRCPTNKDTEATSFDRFELAGDATEERSGREDRTMLGLTICHCLRRENAQRQVLARLTTLSDRYPVTIAAEGDRQPRRSSSSSALWRSGLFH